MIKDGEFTLLKLRFGGFLAMFAMHASVLLRISSINGEILNGAKRFSAELAHPAARTLARVFLAMADMMAGETSMNSLRVWAWVESAWRSLDS